MFPVKKKVYEGGTLCELPLERIEKSPNQPRKRFDDYELALLAASIKENGLLQPISVRREGNGFVLIAGERRLRAAKIAGLKTLPAIIYEKNENDAAVLTLLENLQRSDLSPFEEAEGIRRLIAVYGISQCDAAARLGMAQSTLSNKLRILKLTESQRERIEAAGLTERHARALLKIEKERRDDALDRIIAQDLTVTQAEKMLEQMEGKAVQMSLPLRAMGIGDVRLFANSLSKIVDTMIKAGYKTKTRKNETDSYIEYTVRIDKRSAQLTLL